MSLSGTLDTLSISELLTVLAATRRSGELVVRGPGLEGRLWLAHGRLVKSDVPETSDMVGAVTALLAVGAGEFAFTTDTTPIDGSESMPVEQVVSEAQLRHSEWLALRAAVPSLASKFRLAAQPAAQTVSVGADDWRVLVALERSVDVRRAMHELDLPEIEVRRSVRALRDAGLVEPAHEDQPQPSPLPEPTVPPVTMPPEVVSAKVVSAEVVSAEVVSAEVVPESETVVGPEHESSPGPMGDDEPVSRSLLFRYLSGEHS